MAGERSQAHRILTSPHPRRPTKRSYPWRTDLPSNTRSNSKDAAHREVEEPHGAKKLMCFWRTTIVEWTRFRSIVLRRLDPCMVTAGGNSAAQWPVKFWQKDHEFFGAPKAGAASAAARRSWLCTQSTSGSQALSSSQRGGSGTLMCSMGTHPRSGSLPSDPMRGHASLRYPSLHCRDTAWQASPSSRRSGAQFCVRAGVPLREAQHFICRGGTRSCVVSRRQSLRSS